MKKFKPNYNDGMWKGAPSSLFLKAQSLRNNETQAEKILWEKLKNNQLKGNKFRRQHPISLFIADFYCHKLKLIIEVDGEYHNTLEQIKKDDERTQVLQDNGVKIIRFTNCEIENNVDKVITEIGLIIEEITVEKNLR